MVHGSCSYGVAHCFLNVVGEEPLQGLATTKINYVYLLTEQN